MRWGLIIWCLAGLVALGMKAHLDLTAAKYPDIAVRAGNSVYHVPRTIVTNEESWRADVARLSGCWDAREAGVLGFTSTVTGCDRPRALHLDFARLPGADLSLLGRYALNAAFWRNYQPPAEQLRELSGVWGRVPVAYRSDWQLFRIDVPGTPWVYLLAAMPKSREQITDVFAGRCFRSDFATDIGMSCSFVEHLDSRAALEYSFGPDAVPEFAAMRASALDVVRRWKRPTS
ncbi:MAG: hypothetical protein ABL973_00350 [Micropepsaceae bacterium]